MLNQVEMINSCDGFKVYVLIGWFQRLHTVTDSIQHKSVVFLAGAALDLISSLPGRDYNTKIYYVTPRNAVGDTLRDT